MRHFNNKNRELYRISNDTTDNAKFYHLNKIVDELNNTSSAYTSLIATVSQSSTDAPTFNVLKNTLGDYTVAYTSAGIYTITFAGKIPDINNAMVFIGNGTVHRVVNDYYPSFVDAQVTDVDTITITVIDTYTHAYADDLLSSCPIEIRVYN